MAQKKAMSVEETLDPEDWESMQVLGHQMVDDMMEYMKTIRQRPVWQHAPDEVKEVADYITLDVDHSGLAAAIDRFLL